MTDFEIAYLFFCIMGFIVFAGTLAIETHLSDPPPRANRAATAPDTVHDKKSPSNA